MKYKAKLLNIFQRWSLVNIILANLIQKHAESFLDNFSRGVVLIRRAHISRIHIDIYRNQWADRHGAVFYGLQMAVNIYLFNSDRHPKDVVHQFLEVLAKIVNFDVNFGVVVGEDEVLTLR